MLLGALFALASGSPAAVVPIVEGEYTSLRQYCDTKVDGRALQGDGGADRIGGSARRDLLRGGGGNDRLGGRARGDCLQAQSGDDRIAGAAGTDVISAASGDDRVSGGPGADVIDCGSGEDRVVADARDDIARDCERVTEE